MLSLQLVLVAYSKSCLSWLGYLKRCGLSGGNESFTAKAIKGRPVQKREPSEREGATLAADDSNSGGGL